MSLECADCGFPDAIRRRGIRETLCEPCERERIDAMLEELEREGKVEQVRPGVWGGKGDWACKPST
jgi:hypothetical protein